MDYPTNITLLLLQLALDEQNNLVHNDKSLDLNKLIKDPIINNDVLSRFQEHILVKVYAPEVQSITLRGLKSTVKDIFNNGIPDNSNNEPLTIVTLANYLYSKRIKELEEVELPNLKKGIEDFLRSSK